MRIYTCENFGRSWLSREIVFGVVFAVGSDHFSVSHAASGSRPMLLQLLAGSRLCSVSRSSSPRG